MAEIELIIDGKPCVCEEGRTILQAAAENGIRIPTLCHYKELTETGTCMICMVSITSQKKERLACTTKAENGMVIETNSESIRKGRKDRLEKILSHHAVDCHHCLRNGACSPESLDPSFCESCFFCDCVREGFCDLQKLASEYRIGVLPYKIYPDDHEIDDSTGCIIRNPNKCIDCRRCIQVCGSVQSVYNLVSLKVGETRIAVPRHQKILADSDCIRCGRCVEYCPTGALHMKEHIDEILYWTHSYEAESAVLLSEDVISELSALYQIDSGELTWEKVCAALRKIGVDYVYREEDIDRIRKSHAVSLIEESIRKQRNANHKTKKPIFLTDSPSVLRFMKKEFSDEVMYCENAQAIFSSLIKENRKDDVLLKRIHVTNRKEMAQQAIDTKDVDYVINARELYRIFIRTGAAPVKRIPSSADSLALPEYSAKENPIYTILSASGFQFSEKVQQFNIADGEQLLRFAVTHNLRQLTSLKKEELSQYDVIWLMC